MYNVIQTKMEIDSREIDVYGLRHEDGTTIENVTANEAEAKCLADLFNQNDLSSCHLADTLADILDSETGFELLNK